MDRSDNYVMGYMMLCIIFVIMSIWISVYYWIGYGISIALQLLWIFKKTIPKFGE